LLTDFYGKTIATLADMQGDAGSYTVTVDPAALNMVPGDYLYKLIFDGTNMKSDDPKRNIPAVKVNMMVFTR
jgi:hypothetical protein